MWSRIRQWVHKNDLRVRQDDKGIVIIDFENPLSMPSDLQERQALVGLMWKWAGSSESEGIITSASGKQFRIHRVIG